MRALLTFLFALLASPAFAQSWIGIDNTVNPSLFRLESAVAGDPTAGGICSAGMINPAKFYVLTVAHCVPVVTEGRSITVGNLHAEVIKVNYLLDLAILQVEGLQGKVIYVRETPAEVGEPIAITGFGFGDKRPKWTFGHVSDYGYQPSNILVDGVTVPGQSGGLAVDAQGRLVGAVQGYIYAGSAGQASHLALTSNSDAVRAFAKPFLPEPPKKAAARK